MTSDVYGELVYKFRHIAGQRETQGGVTESRDEAHHRRRFGQQAGNGARGELRFFLFFEQFCPAFERVVGVT